MTQFLNGLIGGIGLFVTLWIVFYMIPFMIRKGWGDAENRTKKVCDVCFRDIKKWNDVVKKHGKGKETN